MEFEPISEKEECIGKQIVDAAFCVHKQLGPGLLENVYETCFCYELKKRNIKAERQLKIPIKYDGIIIDDGLRLDVLVDSSVICEIKAVENYNVVWQAQLLSYLRLTGKRLGYLINFNVPIIRKGIKRIVL